jgi:hypothetical protein
MLQKTREPKHFRDFPTHTPPCPDKNSLLISTSLGGSLINVYFRQDCVALGRVVVTVASQDWKYRHLGSRSSPQTSQPSLGKPYKVLNIMENLTNFQQ